MTRAASAKTDVGGTGPASRRDCGLVASVACSQVETEVVV